MWRYVKDSVQKFKKDLFAKLIYDTLKYLMVILVSFFLLHLIPPIQQIISDAILITIWHFALILILEAVFILVVLGIIFNIKFRRLKNEHQVDELTGLKNHKALAESLDSIFNKKIPIDRYPISVLLFDIDNFKMFNTSHGYGVADKILSKLGELLKNDSRVTDEIYRYFRRGDEFLLVAYKTNLSDAKKAGDRKRILISDTNFMIDQNSFKLTVSCGLTEIADIDTEESLRNKLNIALLKAKSYDGKNRTEIIT